MSEFDYIKTVFVTCNIIPHKYALSGYVNINYRLPIKVYYRICTLRHIRIDINHGSQNVF
jgi:hypothetical protein